jgi:hypothetical protein
LYLKRDGRTGRKRVAPRRLNLSPLGERFFVLIIVR